MRSSFLILSIFVGSLFYSFVGIDRSLCSCTGKTYMTMEEALKDVENTTCLDLGMTKLKSLSSDVGKLTNLKCLDLSFNHISTLPSEIKNLEKLEYINLKGTRYMAKLPAILKEVKNLKTIELQDHPEWSQATKDEAKAMLPNVNIIFEVAESKPIEIKIPGSN